MGYNTFIEGGGYPDLSGSTKFFLFLYVSFLRDTIFILIVLTKSNLFVFIIFFISGSSWPRTPPEPAPAQEVFMAPAPKTKESPQPDHPGVRTRGGGRHLCCKCVCKSEIFSQNQNSEWICEGQWGKREAQKNETKSPIYVLLFNIYRGRLFFKVITFSVNVNSIILANSGIFLNKIWLNP